MRHTIDTRETTTTVGLALLQALVGDVDRVLVVHGPPGAGAEAWAKHAAPDRSVSWYGDTMPRTRASVLRICGDAGVPATAIALLASRHACGHALHVADRSKWYDAMGTVPVLAEGFAGVVRVVQRADYRTSESRAQERGQTFYRWRTRQDSRVRPSHRDRHGRLFSWLYPPDGGHPGEDWGCRCWAESVSDDDVVELTRRGGVVELRARPLTVPRWARQR